MTTTEHRTDPDTLVVHMVRRWGVLASITSIVDGWTSTRAIPYFEINAQVQGALYREAAEKVARDIITTISPDAGEDAITVTVEPIFTP